LTNDMVRAAVARHPQRLLGFVGADPIGEDPGRVREAAVEAIDHWGFRGVGELCGISGDAPPWSRLAGPPSDAPPSHDPGDA
jgi:hypothetical protein